MTEAADREDYGRFPQTARGLHHTAVSNRSDLDDGWSKTTTSRIIWTEVGKIIALSAGALAVVKLDELFPPGTVSPLLSFTQFIGELTLALLIVGNFVYLLDRILEGLGRSTIFNLTSRFFIWSYRRYKQSRIESTDHSMRKGVDRLRPGLFSSGLVNPTAEAGQNKIDVLGNSRRAVQKESDKAPAKATQPPSV